MELLVIGVLGFFSMFFLVVGFTPSKKIDIKGMYGDLDAETRTGIIFALTPFTKKLEKINGKIHTPRLDNYRTYVTKRLGMSGNPLNLTADELLGFQEILFLFLFLFSSLFFIKMPEGNILQKIVFVFLIIGIDVILSFVLPIFILNDAIKERHKKMSRELPYTLDLLTISIEAGLDFVMAMSRVIEKGRPGPLRREFSMMMQQIKLGKRRREALQDLAERNGHSDLKTIMAAMIQADQMGASLGPILRIQSDLLRRKRMLRAEKIAQEAPVKMLVPLIGCIFPAVFLILLVPIILKLVTSVK
jgi:tight adherence protein C